ncbi:hypothetical protein ABE10_00610, partial [Bacillus toyonensis]|nr:hypothetical protein [Bacillus toyonensis]
HRQRAHGAPPGMEGEGDHPRGGGDQPRRARRALSALRLADGLRHPEQHERQRGDREQGDPAAGRAARLAEPCRPERRRQHGAVQQRHLPHGDA